MNIEKLEGNIQSLVTNLAEKMFIYDLLLAYGQPNWRLFRSRINLHHLNESGHPL